MDKVKVKLSKVVLQKLKQQEEQEKLKQEEEEEEEQEKLKQQEEQTKELSFKERMDILIKDNQKQILFLRNQLQELRKLQKDHELIVKDALKKNKKKKVNRDFSKPRRSTGFAEPVIVSQVLYSFLVKTNATMKDSTFIPKSQEEYNNWPRIVVKSGCLIARTDITSHISKYIKDNNLQNPEEKREIIPDATLQKIFSYAIEPSKKDPKKLVYTYLKLQKYVNHHFVKKLTL